MKIMIVGAGATGGFLANRLHECGHQISIVARGAHLAAIKADGLRLRRPDLPDYVARVPASSDPRDLGAQDLIITTVKSPALPGVLAQLLPVIDEGTSVVTAMNGVFWWYAEGLNVKGVAPDTLRLDPNRKIASILPVKRAMGLVIHSTNEVIQPGIVRNRSAANRFVMGASDSSGFAHGHELAKALNGPDMDVEFDENIRRTMWRKLLRNLTTAPTSVLTNAQAYDVINDPDAQNVARALFLEGCAVANTHGFSGLELEEAQVFKKGGGAHQKPSMCQDIDLKRPMEIDSILRIVQDFARQADLSVPTLDTVTSLVLLRARLAGCYNS